MVTQHDGSMLRLRKLDADYDPPDRIAAMNYLQERAATGEIVTGLLYVDPQGEELHDYLNTVTRRSTSSAPPSSPRQRRARQAQREPALGFRFSI